LKALTACMKKGDIFLPLSPRLSIQEKKRIKKQMQELESALSKFSQKNSGGLFILTSGSTSFPKIAFHSWESSLQNAEASAHFLRLQPQDLWHLNLPFWHIGGVMAALRCLSVGASVTENAEEATFTSWVPTHLYRLVKEEKKAISCLKCALVGGAPVDKELLEKALKLGYPVHETYGLTEMGAMVTLDGQILPGKQVRIDKASNEILVKGQGLFQGYLNLDGYDEKSLSKPIGQVEELLQKPFTEEGWFQTGDLGELDSEGKLHVLGRKDNLFISGGENIQPEEIERLLISHPRVLEAVVVPLADSEYGYRPVAFIQSLEKLSAPLSSSVSLGLQQELKVYLIERTAKFKVPVLWLSWPQSLETGHRKIKRAYFKSLLEQLV